MMDPKKMKHHTGKGTKGMTHAYAKGGAIGPSKHGGGKSEDNPYPKAMSNRREALIDTPTLDEWRRTPGSEAYNRGPDSSEDGKPRYEGMGDGVSDYPKSLRPRREAHIDTPTLDEMRRTPGSEGYQREPEDQPDGKPRHYAKGGRVMKGKRC